jgi:hypothetical protein
MLPGWQAAAQRIVADAEQALAHPTAGVAARAYLTGRGITPATWHAWRLGLRLTWHPVRRLPQPAIVLPWLGIPEPGAVPADRSDAPKLAIQAVQYRFFPITSEPVPHRDRFAQLRGGQRRLFGLHLRRGCETLVLCEGELNAVSLWQVLHERADVLSCGSQEGLVGTRMHPLLQSLTASYRRAFIWLDEPARAAAAVDAIAPDTGHALWSEEGRDANDRLRDGTLIAWLAARGL